MREPGALRRLLQMKSFLDLEQPSDADAPGEFGRSFEANDGTLDRNDGIRPAWAPIGIDKLLRIVRVALETYVWMPVALAIHIENQTPDPRQRHGQWEQDFHHKPTCTINESQQHTGPPRRTQ